MIYILDFDWFPVFGETLIWQLSDNFKVKTIE